MKCRALCVFVLALTAVAGVSSQQQPPRDPPPPPSEAMRLERDVQARIATTGLTAALAMELSRIQETAGAFDRAEATLLSARSAFPTDASVARELAGFYNRRGKFAQTIRTMEEAAAMQPGDPLGYYVVATYYEEKLRKDDKLSAAERLAYILKGIEAIDRAIALDSDYSEALVYKNILLRHQVRVEPDPGRQALLTEQADQLRARAIELTRLRVGVASAVRADGAAPPAPPPPPSTRPPCDHAGHLPITGMMPVRVGGNIKAPTKTVDARPVYPSEAQFARIQGVVILEVTVAEDGTVAGACVLRSVPLLDNAAIDAVRQWRYMPTLLNGAPVPVIMTATVNFVLQ